MAAPTHLGFVFLVAGISVCFCASPLKHFSTKTPYAWVMNPKPSEVLDDDWYYLKEMNGMVCSAVHTSAIIRHGTRYPGLDDVEEISNVHDKLVETMEPNVNPELYSWENKFPSNNNKALADLGEEEQEELGTRIGRRLKTLFEDEDLSNFKFYVSSKERTKQSAASFYEGIAKVAHGDDIEDDFDIEVNDEYLRFFDLCAKYVFSVGNNKTAMKEFDAFLNSGKVKAIKAKITEKLNVGEDILTPANVRLIYLICGYETAIFKSSPWCSLLDDSDLEILEYLGDLKHYYKNGYGYDITWQQSCPLLSEIFLTMDDTILEIESTEEEEQMEGFIVGQFAFGHAETIGPIFSALGLFNSSLPLKADNYDEQQNRLFRTSNIMPFSANIVLVLYECVPEEFGEDEEIEEADYYIKVFVNELPVIIPGCDDVVCPYKLVRKQYETMIDRCDFKGICKKPALKDEL